MRVLRVLLADDEELIRLALAALLDLEPDIEVVAHAGDGRAALDAALAHRPDVAVLDLEMPAPGGVEVAAELTRALPGCAPVILTGHGRPAQLRPALAAGVRGFLAKGAPGGALADVIRRVLRRLAAMRGVMRRLQLDGDRDEELARSVGLDTAELEAMYRLLAIAKYEDRYVIPKAHAELADRLEAEHAGCSLEGGPGGYGSIGYPPQRMPSGRRLNLLGDDT